MKFNLVIRRVATMMLHLNLINAIPAHLPASNGLTLLQLPNITGTNILPTPNWRAPNHNITTTNNRVETEYQIPHTLLTLLITSNPDAPMSGAAILYCLYKASSEAKTQNPNIPLQVGRNYLWRAAQTKFGLAPAPYSEPEYDLNWGDVIRICDGLKNLLQDSGQWQEMNFYIRDGRRGALGAGLLRSSRRRVAATA